MIRIAIDGKYFRVYDDDLLLANFTTPEAAEKHAEASKRKLERLGPAPARSRLFVPVRASASVVAETFDALVHHKKIA